MSTLKITGKVTNALGMALAISIYSDQQDAVYEKIFTTDFENDIDLIAGKYVLDLQGDTQGSLTITIDGYDTIDHQPPPTYDQLISDEFTITMS